MNIKALVGAGLAFAKKHQGVILTGVSISAYAFSVYKALKNSPKILAKLDELNSEGGATTLEKAKAILPETLEVAVPFALGATSQIVCTKKLSDTVSSLASAVTIYKTINDKTHETIEEVAGTETADKVKEKMAGMKADCQYSSSMFNAEKIEVTGRGNDLIYFEDFDKWFYGSVNWVEKCINGCNSRLNEGEPISVNDLLGDIGLKRVPVFQKIGWHEYDDRIDVSTDGSMNDDNRPYAIISLKSSSRPRDMYQRRY